MIKCHFGGYSHSPLSDAIVMTCELPSGQGEQVFETVRWLAETGPAGWLFSHGLVKAMVIYREFMVEDDDVDHEDFLWIARLPCWFWTAVCCCDLTWQIDPLKQRIVDPSNFMGTIAFSNAPTTRCPTILPNHISHISQHDHWLPIWPKQKYHPIFWNGFQPAKKRQSTFATFRFHRLDSVPQPQDQSFGGWPIDHSTARVS